MQHDAINNFIVSELGKNRSTSEVARSLSEQGLMDWNQAEARVKQIRHSHASRIAKKQMPRKMFVVISGLIMGSLMTFLALVGFVFYWPQDTGTSYSSSSRSIPIECVIPGLDGYVESHPLLREQCAGVSPDNMLGLIMISMLGTGLSLLAGSLWNSGGVFKAFFEMINQKK